ncbi:NAD(P)-dependent glycerol-3-phosphate dehydrogenase [bacterium]|nr:MAG: NAD(P)-dependent glycerol-3-phosphate dehydrogenase [bacterium]
MRVAVLGTGSWGTALAILLARNGHDVDLLGRSVEEVQSIDARRENLRYLPGFALPRNVSAGMLGEATEVDLAVVAVPSAAIREIVTQLPPGNPRVVVASKGLEPHTGGFMVDVVKEARPASAVGVLSGPNLAIEIARGVPTVALSAFDRRSDAEAVQNAFTCATFRVSVTEDVVGVELAGALKNVLAIGGGMSDGLGFGDNTKGAFLSRGLMEVARLGTAMGARTETFLGPAGVGDLFATANSRLSRNYRVGEALGKGMNLTEALAVVGQVAEGVPTSEAAQILARKYEVELPVLAAVEGVLRGRISPRQAVAMLMDRAPRMDGFLGS